MEPELEDHADASGFIEEEREEYRTRGVSDFTDLRVWSNAMELAVQVYDLTKQFPLDERFGLTQQMRRSSVSIPSNIAEGQARGGPGDFGRFLGIARGSAAELRTQLLLSSRLGYSNPDEVSVILDRVDHVARQLTSLRNSILNRNDTGIK